MNLYKIAIVLTVFSSGKAEDVESRVFNGHMVRSGEQTHLVKISEPNICSGSIIGPTWVITAAHCVQEHSMTYVFHHSEPSEPIAYINRRYLHPQFHKDPKVEQITPHEMNVDIALLKTSPILFNQFIQPINLMGRLPRVNEMAMIAGYGDTNWGPVTTIPLQGKLPISQCPFSFRKTTVICSIDLVASGPGDSGGPLTTDEGLAGVISGGICIPQIKTCISAACSIADKLTWINSVMNSSK